MLPANLLDATRELERCDVLRAALGRGRDEDYLDYYVACKRREWQQAHEQITQVGARSLPSAVLTVLSDEQVESFHRDGFLIIEEGFISDGRDRGAARALRPAVRGRVRHRHPARRGQLEGAAATPRTCTRQICNGWRADDVIAAQVLSERTGRLAAQLMGYGGARMLQDNCLWKPPGARSLGMHQDGSYADYLVPAEMITCWVALDDTRAEGGTIEYARGSHRWPKVAPDRGSFHAPDDWLAPLRAAAPDGRGARAGAGRGQGRRLLVPPLADLPRLGPQPGRHATGARSSRTCCRPTTRFHPTHVDQTYSRYRRRGDLSMDESFFPVLWDATGGRTPWLQELPELP